MSEDRVVVSSHWNSQTNRIDGEEFDSYEAALAEIARLIGDSAQDEIEVVDVDGATQSWLVYGSEEDAESDSEGQNPQAAVASISVAKEVR